ncbi:MAG TPA: autotransporter outer membrane beta-barrel domain-containing protein [Afipia sp.]
MSKRLKSGGNINRRRPLVGALYVIGLRDRFGLRRAMLGTALLAVIGAPAFAQSIDTRPSWDGTQEIGLRGTSGTTAFGQSITAGSSPSRLLSFSFEVLQGSGIPQQYQAYVYQWDPVTSRMVGSALFTSGVMTAPATAGAFVPMTINTGGVVLSPGQQYALFVTTSSVGAQADGLYRFGFTAGTAYSGGSFIAQSSPTLAGLLGQSWGSINFDLAFTATIIPGLPVAGQNGIEAQQGVVQLMHQYLNVLTDPFVTDRGGASAIGFAPERPSNVPAGVASAFARFNKAPNGYEPRYSMWGTAFGGGNKSSGVSTLGISDTSTTVGGFAAGVDYKFSPNSMIGFSLAGGGTSWSVSDNNGGGRSDALLVGVYGAHSFNTSYYLSGALSFGNYWTTTNRTVGADQFDAKFNVQNFGGRFELGRHFQAPEGVRLTPYVAIQSQFYTTPSYTETASAGAGAFALAFASRDAWVVRSEAGSRLDKTWRLPSGGSLRAFGKLAYGHDEYSDPTIAASFSGFAIPAFAVGGVMPAHDLALVAAGSEWMMGKGWSLMAKFDGEFSERTQTYAGTGRVRYVW